MDNDENQNIDRGEIPLVSAEYDDTNVLFRHKTIRRYKIGEFEFRNYEMRITDAAKLDRWRKLLADPNLPRSELIDIFEINEEAAAVVERSVAGDSPVIRGAMQASDILTAKDRQRLEEAQKAQGNQLDLGTGNKPTAIPKATPNFSFTK